MSSLLDAVLRSLSERSLKAQPSPKSPWRRAGRRARSCATSRRLQALWLPKLEGLESRSVPDAGFGFEAAGNNLVFTVHGTNADDTLAVWSEANTHYFTVQYTDIDGFIQLQEGSVTGAEIEAAESRYGLTFAGFKLVGGEGDDSLDASSESLNVFLIGGAGNDLLLGGSGADTLWGGEGDDILFGGIGNDTLEGDGGDDLLEGGDGDDLLTGGESADRLRGGLGSDRVVGDARDVELGGGTGGERGAGDALLWDTRVVSEGMTFANYDFETISGSEFADWIDSSLYAGPAAGVTVNGAGGNDTIIGSPGGDTLSGGEGDDTIEGRSGADVVDGGGGVDTLSYQHSPAGVEVDLLLRSAGGGDAEGDSFEGVENLTGSAFDDILTGDRGANTLTGLGGNDLLFGGRGDDLLFGGDGDDELIGSFGRDVLDGESGANRLLGGNDGDVLVFDFTLLTSQEIYGGLESDTFAARNVPGLVDVANAEDVERVLRALAAHRKTGKTDFQAGFDSLSFAVGGGVPPPSPPSPPPAPPPPAPVPPTLLAENLVLSATTVSEGELVRLSGIFSDPDAAEPHRVWIDWGDGGAPTVLELPSGVYEFSAEYRYPDDFGAGRAQAVVSVKVTDSTGESAPATATVTVRNAAPEALSVTLSQLTIDEGGTVEVGGAFTDPGVLDGHRVSIDWGDGSAPTTFDVAVGAREFGPLRHTYLDDPVGGAYAIVITVSDSDGGVATTSTGLTVRNVAPAVLSTSLALTPEIVFEGSPVTLFGEVFDPAAGDPVTVSIDWGDGSEPTEVELPPGATRFQASHTYSKNSLAQSPAGAYLVTVTARDREAAGEPVAKSLRIGNLPPVLTELRAEAAIEGEVTVLEGRVRDAGADGITIKVEWGDGTAPQEVRLAPGRQTFRIAHRYLDNGPAGGYTVLVRAADDDGGVSIAEVQVLVANSPPQVQIHSPAQQGVSQGEPVELFCAVADLGQLDTFSYAWEVVRDGTAAPLLGDQSTFRFTPEAPGVYQVRVTVQDNAGGRSESSFSLFVTQAPPRPAFPTPAPAPPPTPPPTPTPAPGAASPPPTAPSPSAPGAAGRIPTDSADPLQPNAAPPLAGSEPEAKHPTDQAAAGGRVASPIQTAFTLPFAPVASPFVLPAATGDRAGGQPARIPSDPFDLPLGMPKTYGSTAGGTADSGESSGELGGVVFEDLNGDGVRAAGEKGLPGRVVVLEREVEGTMREVGKATTDAKGAFQFRGLGAGKYRVSVQPTPGKGPAVSGEVIELSRESTLDLGLPPSACEGGGREEENPAEPEDDDRSEPARCGSLVFALVLASASQKRAAGGRAEPKGRGCGRYS